MNKGEVGTVGYELRREVRDALPPGLLTGMECLVLLELADDANDETRKGYPTLEKLAALLGREPRTIKEALSGVWSKWVDLRVVLRLDKDGRPVYAYRGRPAEVQFPARLVPAAPFVSNTSFNRPEVPAPVRRAVFARDGRQCVKCGALNELVLDHIYPWSRGGLHTVENLRVLCQPCNRLKGDRIEDEGAC